MEESILISIKKLLGITADYTHFDLDIMMHINSAFMVLNQLGLGPEEGFSIEDDSAIWSDFIYDFRKYQSVKSYIYLKVKLLFDTSSLSSTLIDAMERQIKEYEWRLNVQTEYTPEVTT